MKNLVKVSGLAVLLGLSSPAYADNMMGWYGSLNLGVAQPLDHAVDDSGHGLSATGEFSFDKGFGIDGAMGHDFGQFRVEGEISWRKADIDSMEIKNAAGTVAGINLARANGTKIGINGDIQSLGLMVNTWYDIDTGSPWTPFIGGGLGAARISAEMKSVSALGVTLPLSADDYDWAFAYQIGAGIGYAISEKTTIQAGYRYFGTDKLSFTNERAEFHNVTVGLRYTF